MSTTALHRPLLSVQDVAGELKVSEKTVRRLIRKGIALPALKVGAQVRIDPEELEAYIYGESA